MNFKQNTFHLDETKNQIWLPIDWTIHENADLGTVIRDKSFFLGIKCNTSELPPDIQSQSQNLLHSGAENDLITIQKFKVVYPCQMNITYFPFDKQLCNFILKMETKGNRSVIFAADPDQHSVSCGGPNLLHEFELIDIK